MHHSAIQQYLQRAMHIITIVHTDGYVQRFSCEVAPPDDIDSPSVDKLAPALRWLPDDAMFAALAANIITTPDDLLWFIYFRDCHLIAEPNN